MARRDPGSAQRRLRGAGEPDAGAGGERASVGSSGRRGGASHGRGQRADPAEPPTAQRRRALPDRRQRGHGQRQGTAGSRRRAPGPGPGGCACGAAAGHVSCCSHRVARAPPLLAALQRPVFPAPTAGQAGGRAGIPVIEVPGGRRPPGAGLARSRSLFFSAAVTRGPAPCAGLAGKADAYCFAGPTVGERAFGRVAGEPPMRPLPPAPPGGPGYPGRGKPGSRTWRTARTREAASRGPEPVLGWGLQGFLGKILSAN